MATYAQRYRDLPRPDVTCRQAERQAFERAFILAPVRGSTADLLRASACQSTGRTALVPAAAIGRSTPTVRLQDRWSGLAELAASRGTPAAFWTALVELEPALEVFSFGRRVTREALIARCELIASRHAVWNWTLALDAVAADYIVGVALDALVLLATAERGGPSPDRAHRLATAGNEWDMMCHCSLCWRLVPLGGPRTGFRTPSERTITPGQRPVRRGRGALNTPINALCTEHTPTISKETRAAWQRDKRHRSVLVEGTWWRGRRRTRKWAPMFLELFPAAAAAGSQVWSGWIRRAFPRLVSAHPTVVAGLPQTMRVLSGLREHAINDLLATVSDKTQQAAFIISGMLISCEKWLSYSQWRRKKLARQNSRRMRRWWRCKTKAKSHKTLSGEVAELQQSLPTNQP